VYEKIECFSAALQDFQSFLTQVPEHPGADSAREAVVRLMRQVSRIN
jgi:regulator of sirC expression with transglutaminase-like and TPR domain